ncbi:MAG TPA: twin-arginine translocase subunit TatC [Candidatus Bathyarchaeia archaeon]|nr:twin-arginine translocase subunit TatC [Candidatus Bathyarchaeia archaeon]
MTFWDHTKELGKRLKIVIYTLIVATIAMLALPANISFLSDPFGSYEPLVGVVLKAVREQALPPGVKLIGIEFVAPLELYVVVSFFFALAITAPVFAYEIFKFVDPALLPEERRAVYPFMSSFLVLFIAGLLFGYLFLVPYGIAALLPFFSLVGAEPFISVSDFYYFVFFLTLLTGMAFTFPTFLVLFVKFGIIATKKLTKNRKYVYIGLLVLVFLITPGEGGLANFMLFAVMAVLFEAGIFFARRYEKKGEVTRPRWSSEEPKCKFCGKTIQKNTTFCENCGKSQT